MLQESPTSAQKRLSDQHHHPSNQRTSKHDENFMSDIDLGTDEEEKNDFRHQLRRRIKEMKRNKTHEKKKNQLDKKNKDQIDSKKVPDVVIEMENENKNKNQRNEKKRKNSSRKLEIKKVIQDLYQSNTTISDPLLEKPGAKIKFEDLLKKNLYIPGDRQQTLSNDEKRLIEGWSYYSKYAKDVQKEEKIKLFMKKLFVGFCSLFLVVLFFVGGTAFLFFNIIGIFNKLKPIEINSTNGTTAIFI